MTSPIKYKPDGDNSKKCGPLCSSNKWKDSICTVITVRIVLLASLVAALVVCSTLSYLWLRDKETRLFRSQYDSISESALAEVTDSFKRMNIGLKEMSSTMSHISPKVEQWPNAAWLGFVESANYLRSLSSLDNAYFLPIVHPGDESASYETFMADFYASDPNTPKPYSIPPYIGMGQIWSLDSQFLPYHDTTGVTNWGSSRHILIPDAQSTYSSTLGPGALGTNLHSLMIFGSIFDMSMDCVDAQINLPVGSRNCGAISAPIELPLTPTPSQPITDMQMLIIQPIFPAQNRSSLVGFVGGSVSWLSLLQDVLPSYVEGIDVVLTCASGVFTFTINNGVPFLRGKGDLHDQSYTRYAHSATLFDNNMSPDVLMISSFPYTITFYPQHSFKDDYETNAPIICSIVIVASFLFCSIVFLVYDQLMKREFGKKQAVLDTKRRYVRFISHEIRTPLNTVRLGLKYFDAELNKHIQLINATTTAIEDIPVLMNNALQAWKGLTGDILENSESAVEVLDDLLNYDKIEMGTLKLEFSLLNVYELVNKTVNIMQIQAQQKEISLELEGDFFDANLGNLLLQNTKISPAPSNDVLDDSSKISNSSSRGPLYHPHAPHQYQAVDNSPAGSLPTTAPPTAGSGTYTKKHRQTSVDLGGFSSRSSQARGQAGGGSYNKPSFDMSRVVVGDGIRMGQVLRNLVSNALKFTPNKGKVVVSIDIDPTGMPDDVPASIKGTSRLFNLHPQCGSVLISVKDSGAGLTAQQLQEIGSEGVQFNANELQAGQGSGLGLFISKGIVEQHGGRLTVASEGLGKGVTFTIELPLYLQQVPNTRRGSVAESGKSSVSSKTKDTLDSIDFQIALSSKRLASCAAAEAVVAVAAPRKNSNGSIQSHGIAFTDLARARSTSAGSKDGVVGSDHRSVAGSGTDSVAGMDGLSLLDIAEEDGSGNSGGYGELHSPLPRNLLVVDDSHFNRKMLIKLLSSKGYLCEQAEDGAQAIVRYEEMRDAGTKLDAILMDFEMPIMNGPTATKKLRELGCNCLIVGVTGNVLPDDVAFFRAHGADYVLPKPLVVEDFEHLVHERHAHVKLGLMEHMPSYSKFIGLSFDYIGGYSSQHSVASGSVHGGNGSSVDEGDHSLPRNVSQQSLSGFAGLFKYPSSLSVSTASTAVTPRPGQPQRVSPAHSHKQVAPSPSSVAASDAARTRSRTSSSNFTSYFAPSPTSAVGMLQASSSSTVNTPSAYNNTRTAAVPTPTNADRARSPPSSPPIAAAATLTHLVIGAVTGSSAYISSQLNSPNDSKVYPTMVEEV